MATVFLEERRGTPLGHTALGHQVEEPPDGADLLGPCQSGPPVQWAHFWHLIAMRLVTYNMGTILWRPSRQITCTQWTENVEV